MRVTVRVTEGAYSWAVTAPLLNWTVPVRSLSVIVTVATARLPTVAPPWAFWSVTVKVSLGSITPSLTSGIVSARDITPSPKSSVPVRDAAPGPAKSKPAAGGAVALPPAIA